MEDDEEDPEGDKKMEDVTDDDENVGDEAEQKSGEKKEQKRD